MHLKVFLKLKKPYLLGKYIKNRKNPKNTKNPKNPKKPLGWVFQKKPGFFSNPGSTHVKMSI
jgi:hypothetical protein